MSTDKFVRSAIVTKHGIIFNAMAVSRLVTCASAKNVEKDMLVIGDLTIQTR